MTKFYHNRTSVDPEVIAESISKGLGRNFLIWGAWK